MGWTGSSASGLAGDLWRKLLGITPREMTWWVTVALVWVGLVLRARGMWFGRPISLWEDEAAWAMWLIDFPLKEHVLRAVGFMAVSKGLVTVLGASERVLRFLPWCAGAGALLLAPLLAKRLFRSAAARLLFIAIVALHPSAIDLSKEFKPYSVALLMHMLLLLFVLRYTDEGRERDLLTAVSMAFVGVLLSQDVVLAYPMVFGVMAFKAYRANNREHLVTLAVGAVCSIALLLAMLHNVAPKLGDTEQDTQYWGGRYNVFFVHAKEQGSRLGWTAERFHDLASMLGNRREMWQWPAISLETLTTLKRLDATLWASLCAAGLVTLAYQRRFLQLTLLVAPLLVLTGFNYFGFWPLGAFRTNLFSVAYFGGMAAAAFDWRSGERVTFSEMLPLALLVALPFLTVGRANHSRKASLTVHAAFPQAGQELVALQGKGRREALVLDARSCAPWRYYTLYHPRHQRDRLAKRFTPHCGKSIPGMLKAARNALSKPGTRVFMLASGDDQMVYLENGLPKDLRVVERKVVGKRDAVVVKVELAAP